MSNKQHTLLASDDVCRALDIGFGFTKFTSGHINPADAKVETRHFPSYASLAGDTAITGNRLGSLDLISVSVEGVAYHVGKDAKIAASGNGRQILESSFFSSPQYMALALGAFSMMAVPERGVIDTLTMGLPLTVFGDAKLRNQIQDRLCTTHEVPTEDGKGTRKISVRKLHILPQVMGSLIALSIHADHIKELPNERSLTIDVGYGTLLWLVTDGMVPIAARSKGNMGGVSSVLKQGIRGVDPEAINNINILKRLDDAIVRNEAEIKIHGKPVKVSDMLKPMQHAITENMTELLASVGDTSDIDNVYLTGGGAHIYRNAVRKAFPKRELANEGGQFTNVIGYQFVSEDRI